MASHSIGTIFVELDLDASRYTRGQQALYQSATSTSLNIETNFRNLGIRSDAVFDLMRQRAQNSFEMITNSARVSANDIARAQQALATQLATIQTQQYAHQRNIFDRIRDDLQQVASSALSTAAVATAAFTALSVGMKATFEKGFKTVEDYNTSIAGLAAMVVTFSERSKGMTLETQWKGALAYSTAMVPILEQIAARTLLSGTETIALANAFARSGVFLDGNNQKQIEGFTRISNALPMMTQGQEIMRQINTEIRSVMTGANESSSMMLTTLKSIDPQLTEHLATWRAEGTVLEHISELLVGFGPATAQLEMQWQAVKSTLDTTVTQVLRGGMEPAYQDIISYTKTLNGLLEKHKTEISGGIVVAWELVKNTLGTVGGVLSGFGPITKDFSYWILQSAYGWGFILAALKPIGKLLGNLISMAWELVRVLGNSAKALALLATGQFDLAQASFDNAAKNIDNVITLTQKSFTIVTDGITGEIDQYYNRTKAFMGEENKKIDSSAATLNTIGSQQEKAAKAQEKLDAQAWLNQSQNATILKENELNALKDRLRGQEEYHKKVVGYDEAAAEAWLNTEAARIVAEEKAAIKADEKASARADKAAESAAAKAKKAAEALAASWVEASAKLDVDIDKTGLPKLEAEFIKIQGEADKLIRKFGEVPGALEEIEKWADSSRISALLKQEAEDMKSLLAGLSMDIDLEKDSKKDAASQTTAIRAMYKDMGESTVGYYDQERSLLKEQYEKYDSYVKDKIALNAWYLNEQKKIQDKETLQNGTFLDGLGVAYRESQEDLLTWGKAAEKVFQDLQKAGTTAISDGLFGALTGEMKSFDELWKSFTKSMLKTFSDIVAKMVIEAAAKEIVLGFKTSWVDTGAAVFDIIAKALGIAANLFGDSDTTNTYAKHAYGGLIGGQMRPGGDSYANDTVHVMASPGEYMIPKSQVNAIASQGRFGDTMLAHINPAEAALLKSLGGSGSKNPKTGLTEFFGWSDIINIVTGGVYGALSGDWGDTKNIWKFINPLMMSGLQALYSKDVWDVVDALFDPVTGPGIDYLTRTTGKAVNDIISWAGELVSVVAPAIGSIVGAVYGGPAGSAGGAFAGTMLAGKWNQETNAESMKKAAIAAAVSYVASSAASYVTGSFSYIAATDESLELASKSAYMKAIASGCDEISAQQIAAKAYTDAVLADIMAARMYKTAVSVASKAVSYATKYTMGAAMGGLFPPETGQVVVDYVGAEDDGLLASLSKSMRGIAPKSSEFEAPMLATGGPVAANMPYIVGEIGPELFVPQESGHILSNANMKKLLGMGVQGFEDGTTDPVPFSDDWYKKYFPWQVPGYEEPASGSSGSSTTQTLEEWFTAYTKELKKMLGTTSELGDSLATINDYYTEQTKTATELGASSEQLAQLILDQESAKKKAIEDWLQTETDYYNEMMGLNTELGTSLSEIQKHYDEATKSAQAAGASEADLASITLLAAAVKKKAIDDWSKSEIAYYNQMMGLNSDLGDSLAEIEAHYAAAIASAKAAGLSTSELEAAALAVKKKAEEDYWKDALGYYNSMMGLTSDLQSGLDAANAKFNEYAKAAEGNADTLAAIEKARGDVLAKILADWLTKLVAPFKELADSLLDWNGKMQGGGQEETAIRRAKRHLGDAGYGRPGPGKDPSPNDIDKTIANMSASDAEKYAAALQDYFTTVADALMAAYESLKATRASINQDIEDIANSALTSEQLRKKYADKMSEENVNAWLKLYNSVGPEKQAEMAAQGHQVIMDYYNSELSALKEKHETEIANITAVREKLKSLTYSSFNLALPRDKQASSAQDYEKLYAAAKAPGASSSSVSSYLSFVETYLQSSKDKYKSSDEYQAIYAKIMAEIGALDTQPGKSIEDLTTEQTAEITALNAEVTAALSALGALTDASMVTIGARLLDIYNTLLFLADLAKLNPPDKATNESGLTPEQAIILASGGAGDKWRSVTADGVITTNEILMFYYQDFLTYLKNLDNKNVDLAKIITDYYLLFWTQNDTLYKGLTTWAVAELLLLDAISRNTMDNLLLMTIFHYDLEKWILNLASTLAMPTGDGALINSADINGDKFLSLFELSFHYFVLFESYLKDIETNTDKPTGDSKDSAAIIDIQTKISSMVGGTWETSLYSVLGKGYSDILLAIDSVYKLIAGALSPPSKASAGGSADAILNVTVALNTQDDVTAFLASWAYDQETMPAIIKTDIQFDKQDDVTEFFAAWAYNQEITPTSIIAKTFFDMNDPTTASMSSWIFGGYIPTAYATVMTTNIIRTVYDNAPTAMAMTSSDKSQGFADGGISYGPSSGYSAMLHGTEAVIPLPNGRSLPVEVKSTGNQSQTDPEIKQMLRILIANQSQDKYLNVDGKQFRLYVQEEADINRVNANRRAGNGTRRIT